MIRRNAWTIYEQEADWVIGCMATNTAAVPDNGCTSSFKFWFCLVEMKSIKGE